MIQRALEVADRSEVALHRVTCLLGAAWGLAGTEPDRSLLLVRRAFADIENVAGADPADAARERVPAAGPARPQRGRAGLLEQFDATPSRRSFVDLIPLFYAAALLDGLGTGRPETALIRSRRRRRRRTSR